MLGRAKQSQSTPQKKKQNKTKTKKQNKKNLNTWQIDVLGHFILRFRMT